MKHDIRNRADIEKLVEHFYAKLLLDNEMKIIFHDVVKIDLIQHMPILCDFWEGILFGTGGYRRNTMKKHLDLHFRYPLTPAHFNFWLSTFNQTVDELYDGVKASEAKDKALSIAAVIQVKISNLDEQKFTHPN